MKKLLHRATVLALMLIVLPTAGPVLWLLDVATAIWKGLRHAGQHVRANTLDGWRTVSYAYRVLWAGLKTGRPA